MADLQVEGSELVLHLSNAEKAESVHRDLREPIGVAWLAALAARRLVSSGASARSPRP
jgi:hypothetical protein